MAISAWVNSNFNPCARPEEKPLHSMEGLPFEVWVSLRAMRSFKIEVFTQCRVTTLCWLYAKVVNERADLTASGRPLKTDKQITPPFITRPRHGAA